MNKCFNIQNINFFFFAAIAAMMPFFTKWLSYPIIFWFITAIILYFNDFRTLKRPALDKGTIFLILYYLCVVASLFYSTNKKEAFFDIEVKLSLLIIPLTMVYLKDIYYNKKKIILLIFALSNVLAATICFIIAFKNSISYNDGILSFDPYVACTYEDKNVAPPSYFTYTNFSLFKHTSYFSTYLVFSFFILIDLFKKKFSLVPSKSFNIFIYSISLVIIISALYFLQSKAGYLTFFITLIAYFTGQLIIKEKKYIKGVCFIALIILSVIFLYNKSTRFYYVRQAISQKENFINAVSAKNHKLILESFGIDRISLWIIATEIAKENFLFGCGSGDIHDELNLKFNKYNLTSFSQSKYNVHNQFLETLIVQGIIGLLLLLLWLFYPFFVKKNYTGNNYLFLIFIIILVINFIFESMLNTISGVIFVAFFYGLLSESSTKKIIKNNLL